MHLTQHVPLPLRSMPVVLPVPVVSPVPVVLVPVVPPVPVVLVLVVPPVPVVLVVLVLVVPPVPVVPVVVTGGPLGHSSNARQIAPCVHVRLNVPSKEAHPGEIESRHKVSKVSSVQIVVMTCWPT
jgi:hypothetical protein